MAWQLRIDTLQGSTTDNGFTTTNIDTSSADLLIAFVTWYAGATEPAFSDSKSNTWVPLTLRDGAGSEAQLRIYYATNVSGKVGTGHNFITNGTTNYPSVAIQAWSGAHLTVPFNREAGGNGTGTTTTIQIGSTTTPDQADSLVVSAIGGYVGDDIHTVAIDSSFTLVASQGSPIGAHHYALGHAYKVQVGAGAAVDPIWSGLYDSGDRAIALAVFIPATGGGGGRTALNTRSAPLGMEIGMNWRGDI